MRTAPELPLLFCAAMIASAADWAHLPSPHSQAVTTLLVDSSQARLVAVDAAGISVSDNGGAGWNVADSVPFIACLAQIGSGIFAGTFGNGFWMSADRGLDWHEIADEAMVPLAMASVGDTLFATLGADDTGSSFFASTDSGKTWNPLDSGSRPLRATALAAAGNALVAYVDTGLAYSRDGGHRWTSPAGTQAGLALTQLAVSGTRIYGAGARAGVVFSDDSGATWTRLDTDLHDTVTALAVASDGLYAAFRNTSLWKRALPPAGLARGTARGFGAGWFSTLSSPSRTEFRLHVRGLTGAVLEIFSAGGLRVTSLSTEGSSRLVWNHRGRSGMFYYRLRARAIQGNGQVTYAAAGSLL